MIWNMDETAFTGEYSTKFKTFKLRKTSNSGYSAQKVKGTGNHLTGIILENADGRVLPPLLIFEEKLEMKRWFMPLPTASWSSTEDLEKWFTKLGWFLLNSFTISTPNGSMKKEIIPNVIDKIRSNNVRYIGKEEHLLLMLDGHESRNWFEWLENAQDGNVEVVQLPTNTSLYLQTCDQTINRYFKREMQGFRDLVSIRALMVFG